MIKNISRTFYQVKAELAILSIVERQPVISDSVFVEYVAVKAPNSEAVIKECIKQHGDANWTVVSIETKEVVYAMELEYFISHAKIIERPKSQRRIKE